VRISAQRSSAGVSRHCKSLQLRIWEAQVVSVTAVKAYRAVGRYWYRMLPLKIPGDTAESRARRFAGVTAYEAGR
jgi:hypothetical protein